MEAHKGIVNKLIDAVAHSTPFSSPLRRKSIMLQKTVAPSSIVENDDEAERLARRREFSGTSISLSTANANDRRCSLGLSALGSIPSTQMEARISQCIKLGTENKINPKNAFSLEMIDFMTYMIKKQDVNMSNLQVASVSLDVSTKIYAFRVDGVHMDILKLIGGLENQEKNNESARDNEAELMDTEEGNGNNQVQMKKKTRKRMKQQILVKVESLRTNVETEKPTLTSMESDLQTTDMLFQATLPNHAGSRFYFHPYNDILIDTVEHKQIQDNDINYRIPTIKDISQMQICPPMFYFDFQSFDANDETEEAQPEKINENTFQFDLNASLPQDNDESCTAVNYFDVIDMQEENVDKCVKLPDQIDNIVDFREVLASTVQSKPSEYSFIRQNLNIHWTGPSHWKLAASKKNFGNSNVMEKCHQAPVRRKKELEIIYSKETIESIEAKYFQNKRSKIHTRTPKMEWNEEILTLPPDQHYDIAYANKSYLHTTIFKPSESTDEMNTTNVSDIVENYDYNNDNDTSNYCPQTNVDEYRGPEENNADDCMLSTQPLTGSNLVSMPKLTNKTTIAYCVRAKKIDMKQLKHAIWKCLSQNSNDQDMIVDANKSLQNSNDMIGTKSFNKIYKMLPMLLTKNNAESLSFPISFVSLLHLANEKTLQVFSSLDMTDLFVKQD
ncbi:condensin complex subunit 2 [Megalopta genalis]|uniref:condensin complex subunit 2 n=1 Tax=Megalopta genalis TaxID=115081 RepID=UPI003FCFE0C0